MINAGGSDNVKKADGIKEPSELHKQFLRKNSNENYFSIGCCC